MAFQGSLAELPLPDILQLVAVSGKTGSFTIENDRERGRIFLSEGQIVHAETRTLTGEEAVYELAIWPEGEFRFTPGEVSVEPTISKSNTSLLMEAARRIDEWQVLAKRVPSTALVPVYAETGGRSAISLSPEEWMVVRKIDERRSVEELANEIQMSPFETSKVLYGLITNGLVELQEKLRELPIERLRSMSAEELRAVAQQLQKEVGAYLAGHSRAEELRDVVAAAVARFQESATGEKMVELFRAAERAVSTALGPNQARSFLDKVTGLVERRSG
ncbi:MAG: DUF4388 domain-containing protein [Thermoanaerobaculia bacterium]|nr:DUF4388 domain-containing protein [Thermoanaerobaculia bacterium]